MLLERTLIAEIIQGDLSEQAAGCFDEALWFEMVRCSTIL
jgi:hypothetical protein